MRTATIYAILLLSLAVMPAASSAQNSADPMTTGILAFRESRFEDAAKAFERAVAQDDTNAEAHFLLARVYFETPLRDVRRAGSELSRALELEPDNVQYLVARMQQLRVETWNFFSEKIREAQRLELARKVLEIDPTNAFANEELGAMHIRDFWRYRNALMFPSLVFNEYSYRSRSTVDPLASRLQAQVDQVLQDDPGAFGINEDLHIEFGPEVALSDPNSIFLADQFDVERLRDQGVPVVDLSRRAQNAYEQAIGYLTTALETDPRHRSIYDFLMEIYTLKGEWPSALEMLQQMYVFFPDDPDLWTYLGLAHYRSSNLDAGSKAFETSFQFMTEDDRAAFIDLSFMVPDGERDEYEADPSAYAARFWTSKDPRFLTPYNERKVEHYARVTYADLLYGAPALGLRGWDTERGRILIRYGVPLSDVVILPKSTSGVQQAAGQTLSTLDDPGARVSGSLQVLREGTDFDMLDEANTFNIWDYGDFKFVFEDPFRNGEYRLYTPSASDLSAGALPWTNDYVIKAAETFRTIPDRFEYEAPGRQIELPFLVSTFRGTSDATDVLIHYGIPLNQFIESGEIINVTANSGLFVVNEDRDVLAERRRTLYGLRTDQIVSFEDANLWVDSENVSVPPGDVDISVEFETTSGATVGVQRRSVSVPDYTGSRLGVSDVLLAYRIEETDDGRPLTGADVVRNGLSILPAPWSVFNRRQPIYLYFEVYNLTLRADGAAEYEVEAALVPKDTGSGVGRLIRGIFGGGKQGVSVGQTITVESRQDGDYRILDAANQEPGLYILKLKIKDLVAGREAERELELFLE